MRSRSRSPRGASGPDRRSGARNNQAIGREASGTSTTHGAASPAGQALPTGRARHARHVPTRAHHEHTEAAASSSARPRVWTRFLLYAPETAPELIDVQIAQGATVNDAVHAVQCARTRDARLRYPDVFPSELQPLPHLAVAITLPAWCASTYILLDCTRCNGALFCALSSPATTRLNLLAIARLPSDTGIEVFVHDRPTRLEDGEVIDVRTGMCVNFVPSTHSPFAVARLEDMLEDPHSWDLTADLPHVEGRWIYVLTDTEPIHLRPDLEGNRSFREQIASALECQPEHLAIQPSRPRLWDYFDFGILAHTVSIASHGVTGPSAAEPDRAFFILDMRPILCGVSWGFAPHGAVRAQELIDRLHRFCPVGRHTRISGGTPTQQESVARPDSQAMFLASTLVETLCDHFTVHFEDEPSGELTALFWCLTWLLRIPPRVFITIVSDCTAALGLSSGRHGHHNGTGLQGACRAVMQALTATTRRPRLHLQHQKSHVGHPGNELADGLAKFCNRHILPDLFWPTNPMQPFLREGWLPWLWLYLDSFVQPESWPEQIGASFVDRPGPMPELPTQAECEQMLGLRPQDNIDDGSEQVSLSALFLTVNVQSLHSDRTTPAAEPDARAGLIREQLAQLGVSVAALQETRAHSNELFQSQTHLRFVSSRDDQGSYGTELWFSRSHPFISHPTTPVYFEPADFLAVFWDPRTIAVRFARGAVRLRQNAQVVILGDFNVHIDRAYKERFSTFLIYGSPARIPAAMMGLLYLLEAAEFTRNLNGGRHFSHLPFPSLELVSASHTCFLPRGNFVTRGRHFSLPGGLVNQSGHLDDLRRTSPELRARIRDDTRLHLHEIAIRAVTSPTKDTVRRLRDLTGPPRRKQRGATPLPAVEVTPGKLAATHQEAKEKWISHFSAIEDGTVKTAQEIVHSCYLRQHDKDLASYEVTADEAPCLAELETSLRAASVDRAYGFDGVPGEVARYGAPFLAKAIFQLELKSVLRLAEPVQHKGGTLYCVWKRKGPRQDCAAYRGLPSFPVSLPAHSARLFQSACRAKKMPHSLLFLDLQEAFYRIIRPLISGESVTTEAAAHICAAAQLPAGTVHELHDFLGQGSLLRQSGTSPWAAQAVEETLCNTWFRFPNECEIVETRSCTKSGRPLLTLAILPRLLYISAIEGRGQHGAVLRTVPTYRHLGGYLQHNGGLAQEIRFRSAQDKSLLFDSLVATVLFYGSGTWPAINVRLPPPSPWTSDHVVVFVGDPARQWAERTQGSSPPVFSHSDTLGRLANGTPVDFLDELDPQCGFCISLIGLPAPFHASCPSPKSFETDFLAAQFACDLTRLVLRLWSRGIRACLIAPNMQREDIAFLASLPGVQREEQQHDGVLWVGSSPNPFSMFHL
ncbi:unnamed protein product [Symbiodinium sp. KB8]|nr:unnamed protein product [Symbiodinium sp. KB8]